MISVVKSTTLRQAHVKARSSSATSAAAATAAAATAVVKNSSASNSNNNNNKSNHFQNTGDDAAFGSLNHLADSNEKFENDPKPAALQKQQPTPAATAIVVSTVDRKITTSDSDNTNQQPEKASDNQPPQTAVAAVAAAAAASVAAAEAAASAVVVEPSTEGGQQRPRPENIPKFVRVGQKVCFSTVVAAVLIPSSEDISEASKRELWWQATDYAEFRLNYAMRMQDPAMEKDYDYDTPDKYTNNDENCYGYDNADCYGSAGGGSGRLQGNENTVPYAVASVNEPSSAPATVGYHYGNQGGMLCASSSSPVMAGRAQHAPTATVEGVLVVAAAPAPAVLASRSYPSNELCHPGMGIGPQGMKQNGGMFKGNNGVGPVVSSMGQQGYAMKSSRYERVAARPRSNMSPDEQQQKLGSRRRVVVGGGGVVAPPAHAHRRHQAHAGQRVTRGGRPAPACYGGRRDGRNEPDYAMPRGSGFQHGGGVGVGGGGGQFFMNGYPAGVYDAPPPRAAYGNNAHYGHGAAMAEAYLPVQQHQQRHHHAHGGGMVGGVGGGGGGAAYAPSSGGLGAPSVVMMPSPSSSQFSMWRSQLVFSPVMMQ